MTVRHPGRPSRSERRGHRAGRLPGRRGDRRDQAGRHAGPHPRRQRRPARRGRRGLHHQPVQGQPRAVEPAGRSPTARLQAVVLNSGGANATPAPRASRTRTRPPSSWPRCSASARSTSVVCSTGLIGERLPMHVLIAGVDAAVRWQRPGRRQARGHRDHDDRHRAEAGRRRQADGWSIGGMAKGAGMLAPNLATMLVVLTTDADVDRRHLRPRAAARDRRDLRPARLRRLHVDQRHRAADGQRRLRGHRRPRRTSPRRSTGPATDLAKQLLADAEGADHDIASPCWARRPRTRP